MLGTPEVSSTDSIPVGFCSQKLWVLTFLTLKPWAGGTDVGLGLLTSEMFLLKFYPLHMDVGPSRSKSLLLLPAWMDVVSLIL